MQTKRTARFPHIDALKVFGLLLIILAHVSPPKVLFNLRTFDVPLMVILSGFLGFFSYQRHCQAGGNAWRYILKRCIRIAVPTWIFTFGLYIPLHVLAGNQYTLLDLTKIFLFQQKPMSYIWIALVYILSAITIPVVFHTGVNKPRTFCAFFAIYCIYELFVQLDIGTSNALISSVVYQIIPYGLLTWLGMHIACTESRSTKWIAFTAGTVFAALLLFNGIVNRKIIPIQSAKYPATLYYLSYGAFMSMLLFWLFDKKAPRLFSCPLVCFISRSSYWIYLWHIMYIVAGKKLFPVLEWYWRFLIIVPCSIGTVWLQHQCITWLRKHTRIPASVLSLFEG